jgi:protein TonB
MSKPNDTLYLPYGAYELKAHYQRNLMLATGLVLCLVLIAYATALVTSRWQQGAISVESELRLPVEQKIHIGPPPTIIRERPSFRTREAEKDIVRGGIPKPVKEEDLSEEFEEVLIPTNDERRQLVGGLETGSNDGYVPGEAVYVPPGLPPPDSFVPREIEPELIYQAQPEYPRIARLAGVEGVVWVKVLVGTDGTVLDARVAKSSGTVSLDEAAIAAAYKNRFSPAIQNGRPVAVWVTYRVEFVLSE